VPGSTSNSGATPSCSAISASIEATFARFGRRVQSLPRVTVVDQLRGRHLAPSWCLVRGAFGHAGANVCEWRARLSRLRPPWFHRVGYPLAWRRDRRNWVGRRPAPPYTSPSLEGALDAYQLSLRQAFLLATGGSYHAQRWCSRSVLKGTKCRSRRSIPVWTRRCGLAITGRERRRYAYIGIVNKGSCPTRYLF
jgi:hypothetical protein